jgi:hypothetical protein
MAPAKSDKSGFGKPAGPCMEMAYGRFHFCHLHPLKVTKVALAVGEMS